MHQLNKFTLKVIDFPQILSSFMDQRKEEYKVIFYANLIKLYMDNDRILYYFKENTKENIEITIEVLKTIKQIDLSDLVNRTWNSMNKMVTRLTLWPMTSCGINFL